MTEPSVGVFFDVLAAEYTETVERCFHRYREMLWALLDYLPAQQTAHRPVSHILELGCGTGNLTVLIAEKFPDAAITTVDVSSESIQACRERLDPQRSIEFLDADIRELDFESQRFDLILSSITIHHLVAAEKQAFFRRCFDWLHAGGVFAFADQFRGATDELYAKHIANWKAFSLSAGGTEQEYAMWMEHQRAHDHHDTLLDQLEWLRQSGFENLDCVWRHLLWAVVQGRRPGS